MSRRCTFLASLCLAAPVAVAGAHIELLPRVRVDRSAVVLGEVARLHTDDLDLMRKLVHLPVGHAPRPGELAVLQREALAQWVRRHAGIPADQLQWSGAQETRVLRATSQLAGDEIGHAAAEALKAQLAASGRPAEVQVRLVPRDLDVPPGRLRLEVRGVDRAGWRPRTTLWVDVWADERFVRTVPVALEVSALAADPLIPTTSSGAALPGPRTAPPEEADREPAAVMRGDWATLRFLAGPITLERQVEVLQDGRPGQKVRVRQPGAPGQLSARVVGRGQLELVP